MDKETNNKNEGYLNKMEDFIENYWHPLLQKYCIPSKFIKCTQQFYQYLMADGVFIHSNYLRQPDNLVQDQSLLFPNIQKQINQALSQFGSCFVKVNWKSAKDCKSWLGGLQCTHIQDVLRTLKCSSYIAQVLQDYENLYPEHLYLVLKKYKNLDRNLQFRCFVKNDLVSVCQRSTEHVFVDLANKQEYFERIKKFISQTVKARFTKQRFVVDVLVTKKKIYIIDIGPWRQFTNALLFSWDELQTMQKGQLRVIQSAQCVVYQDLGNYNKPNEQQMRWLVSEILQSKY